MKGRINANPARLLIPKKGEAEGQTWKVSERQRGGKTEGQRGNQGYG